MYSSNYPRLYHEKATCTCGGALEVQAFNVRDIGPRKDEVKFWEKKHEKCKEKSK